MFGPVHVGPLEGLVNVPDPCGGTPVRAASSASSRSSERCAAAVGRRSVNVRRIETPMFPEFQPPTCAPTTPLPAASKAGGVVAVPALVDASGLVDQELGPMSPQPLSIAWYR